MIHSYFHATHFNRRDGLSVYSRVACKSQIKSRLRRIVRDYRGASSTSRAVTTQRINPTAFYLVNIVARHDSVVIRETISHAKRRQVPVERASLPRRGILSRRSSLTTKVSTGVDGLGETCGRDRFGLGLQFAASVTEEF